MERITEKDGNGYKLVLKNFGGCNREELYKKEWSIGTSMTGDQTIRGYAIDKFAQYEDLEEGGKLLKLPAAVGEKVYVVRRFCSLPSDCESWPCELCPDYELEINEESFSLDMLDEVGESVFTTPEAAEKALKDKKERKV